MYIENHFFRIFRKTMTTFFHFFKLRPTSFPYLTGDNFRSLADYVHDETDTFNPELVESGDIVFVGNPLMNNFFENIHPRINNRYILIQHNGDYPVDEHIASYMDEKIIRFYAQCTEFAHEKITPIPIGIANKHHGFEGFSWLMNRNIPKDTEKKPRIFFHFIIQTNPQERGPALEYFKKHASMDTINDFVPYGSYKDILASYAFTVSPAGNTLGSHRTWEALYLRTIPIVKRTVDAEYCVANGLPLWILDDWNELDEYTEEKLRLKYTEMMQTARFDSLYMAHWVEKIKTDQKLERNR